MADTILVIGAKGQIGSELVEELRRIHGASRVIATDIKEPSANSWKAVRSYNSTYSTSPPRRDHPQGTRHPGVPPRCLAFSNRRAKVKSAWRLNMEGLLGVLDLAREEKFKLFWPSSIAVFGPTTPRDNTPQITVMEPTTVYGISKQAGERWCEYYHQKFGVDVRSIRYPGLIGYKTEPGGGTTDYAVHIFHEALKHHRYTSFLSEETRLPMMYMPDALRATIGLMDAPPPA